MTYSYTSERKHGGARKHGGSQEAGKPDRVMRRNITWGQGNQQNYTAKTVSKTIKAREAEWWAAGGNSLNITETTDAKAFPQTQQGKSKKALQHSGIEERLTTYPALFPSLPSRLRVLLHRQTVWSATLSWLLARLCTSDIDTTGKIKTASGTTALGEEGGTHDRGISRHPNIPRCPSPAVRRDGMGESY